MLQNLIDTYKEIVHKNRLKWYELKLQKIDNLRAKLKAEAVRIQRDYDKYREQT